MWSLFWLLCTSISSMQITYKESTKIQSFCCACSLLIRDEIDPFFLICQDYMVFDPFMIHSMAEVHDRHRDMRLDVDNMSYEVRTNHYICFLLWSCEYQTCSAYISTGMLGTFGTRRTHRWCQHRFEWRNYFKVHETKNIHVNAFRMPRRCRAMLCLSGRWVV